MTDPYQKAGVNIEAGNALMRCLAPLAASTQHHLGQYGARLLSGIGGFTAAVEITAKNPVLLAASDGVGTKLELARAHGALTVIGKDLVAMCTNDILCGGGWPLFFLDYYACSKLDQAAAMAVLSGVTAACNECDCALVGGETAEMPGVYDNNKFDLAGFCIGIADRDTLLGREKVMAGDALIAIASAGAHSNGFSLIRHLLANDKSLGELVIDGQRLLDWLLQPTRLYYQSIRALRKRIDVHALAHITGGGIVENLPRVLPANATPQFIEGTLPLPPQFAALQQAGNIEEADMRRIFNCGVGMVAVVSASEASEAIALLSELGETSWLIGYVACH